HGAINGFVTETYESLHKKWVKNPYRISNQHDATLQMLNTVRKQNIINYLFQFSKPVGSNVKQNTSVMNGKIFTFELSSFDKFVSSYRNTTTLASEAFEAFNQFLPTLDKFFNLINLAEFITTHLIVSVKWYRSAVISSRDTVRANSNWYGQPIFDNVSINMDSNEIEDYTTYDGLCFGKISSFNEAFYLALVRWYDYKYKNRLNLYDCPWIKLTSQYEFIPVDSVEMTLKIM
ncbi:hypothetical protein RhiirA4_490315, partial [Rhizophagus irregularis]